MKSSALRVFYMGDHLGHRGGGIHGVTTYFLNALPAIEAEGVQPTVVFIGEQHPAAQQLENLGVQARFLGLKKWDPRSFFAFNDSLDAGRHDLLHLFNFKSHLGGTMAAGKRGIPAVVHVHDQLHMPWPMNRVQRGVAPHVAALVGITDSVTAFGSREYGVRKERCHTIENGLDLEQFRRAARVQTPRLHESLGLDSSRSLVAVIGRVHEVKGQRELISSFPRILEHHPQACLLVVGDGPARADCERLVSELKLADHVRFLGQRNDVPAIVSQVKVCVMPSIWEEGFGYAALESMAVGTPVVASDTGGVRVLCKHERNSLLVKAGDLSGLAEAIIRMLEDDDFRNRLSDAAVEDAENFSAARHAKRMVSLYESLL